MTAKPFSSYQEPKTNDQQRSFGVWRAGSRRISLDRPVIVGIVNVTPDSFSDGGRAFSPDDALAWAKRLVDDGADVLDIGGESTRPGASSVSADEELRRVVPVIERIRAALPDVPISVDTVKSDVARGALAAGADIVNDVSAFRLDPAMAALCAEAHCGVVLMHSRGSVTEMAAYDLATYGDDVVADVCSELRASAAAAESAGVCRKHIVLDPGFGFSKRTEHSLAVLRDLERVADLGYPVLVGVSRKRFIGDLGAGRTPAERDAGTTAANIFAWNRGARLFRVHDVRGARQALDVAAKLWN